MHDAEKILCVHNQDPTQLNNTYINTLKDDKKQNRVEMSLQLYSRVDRERQTAYTLKVSPDGYLN